MRTIYLDDQEWRCFAAAKSGLIPYETDFFDGKCDALIEGYRLIPEGKKLILDDGTAFTGFMVAPVKSYTELREAQQENIKSALSFIGVDPVKSPIAGAIELREAINIVVSNIDDETAMSVKSLLPKWDGNGIQYIKDIRLTYNDEFYRCIQNHKSQPDWQPDKAVSLFVKISNPVEEWPKWVQPLGAIDAYRAGDKVSHKGVFYRSILDNNVWEPGIYGWEVYVS